jgi:GT2 family glycosyltransferase
MAPGVTVSVLTHNNERTIRACLRTLFAQRDVAADVFVIDNASRDDTAGVVRREFPQARLVENPVNEYFARGHNRILPFLTRPFLLVLNPDVAMPDPGTVRALVEPMLKDAAIGAGTCPHQTESVGRRTHTTASLLARFTAARAIPGFYRWQVEAQEAAGPGEVEIAQGSCLMIRSEVFRELGGFDPRFDLYFTDDELCLRMRRRGHKIVLGDGPQVRHERSHSLLQLSGERRMRIIQKDLRLYARLYLPWAASAVVHAASAATSLLVRRP